MTLVRNHFEAYFVSFAGRPLKFNGQGLAQCILDGDLGLAGLLVNLNSLGIPAKSRVFDCSEQVGHFGIE
jgi:hypothetical protein